jgi:hypothetical protein
VNRYRFTVNAVLHFDVEANDEATAVSRANFQIAKHPGMEVNELAHGRVHPLRYSPVELVEVDDVLR